MFTLLSCFNATVRIYYNVKIFLSEAKLELNEYVRADGVYEHDCSLGHYITK